MKGRYLSYKGRFSAVFNWISSDNVRGVVDNGIGSTIFLKTPVRIDHGVWANALIVACPEHSVIEAFVNAWGLDWVTIDFGEK